MIVQSGHADDPRVHQFVHQNWDLQPDYFAGLGFDKEGEITPEELRDTPNPRWFGWTTKVAVTGLFAGKLPFLKRVGRAVGTIKLGLLFVGGKRSHVAGLPVANLPLGSVLGGLGGSLSGIDLAEIPGIEDSGLASVSIDKKEGEFILEVTSAAIPTVDLMGKGEAGATLTVTAMNGSFGDLHVEARWPAEGNPAQLPDLRVQVGWLSLGTAVLSAGNLLVGADRLSLQGLEFDSSVSAASEDGRFHMRKFVGNLQGQLAAVISVVESALFAVATTVLGQQESPDKTKVRDAAWFAQALRETLATKFNNAMFGHVSVASVVAEGVVFASGESFERVATSLDLTIAAGPRALASLEMARIEEGAADRGLTPDEQKRMDELMRVTASDQAEARERITELGMDPDEVELRLKVGSPDSKEAISVAGINVPGMVQSPGTISPERATVELRFPGDSVPIPTDADSDAQGRALFTLELDAPGELRTSSDLQLAGLPPLGPITVEGASGEVTVREGGVVSLDVVLPKVGFEGVRSAITVEAQEGVAQGVHVVADLVMDPTRRLGIQRIDNCGVFIEMVTARNIIMERPGAWRLEVLDPVLNGLKLTAGLIDGKLVAETLHVGPGQISGLEASLGTLLKASSQGALSFGAIDIAEIVPYKRHGFTITDLDANQVQVQAGDQAVRIVRFDSKEVEGELGLDLATGELSGIEFSIAGGSVDLGALDLTFPWGRVTARSASLPSFSATAKVTVENPGAADATESLGLTISAVDAPVAQRGGAWLRNPEDWGPRPVGPPAGHPRGAEGSRRWPDPGREGHHGERRNCQCRPFATDGTRDVGARCCLCGNLGHHGKAELPIFLRRHRRSFPSRRSGSRFQRLGAGEEGSAGNLRAGALYRHRRRGYGHGKGARGENPGGHTRPWSGRFHLRRGSREMHERFGAGPSPHGASGSGQGARRRRGAAANHSRTCGGAAGPCRGTGIRTPDPRRARAGPSAGSSRHFGRRHPRWSRGRAHAAGFHSWRAAR